MTAHLHVIVSSLELLLKRVALFFFVYQNNAWVYMFMLVKQISISVYNKSVTVFKKGAGTFNP